ncbi:MAG: FtsW/RodA/SpoVE family cell cycle protein [Clostridiales bacterium]|nr:FtsW/RodA/SpoVE family cell cycle protein [Clostridiales bacterium]
MRVLRPILQYLKETDKLYWLLMITISSYSLLLLKTVPSPADKKLSYFAVQLIAIALGYFGAILFSLIDYHELTSYWYIIAGFCIFLIIYTQIFGTSVVSSGGINAKAWIKLPGGMTFQPSELVKIGFILTFAKHVSVLEERGLLKSFVNVALLALHAGIPVILVHFQGDDGSAIIFFCMFLVMAFGAGIQLRYFAAVFAGLAIGFPVAWKTGILAPYQKERLTTFLHPEDSLKYGGWQQVQGQLSIGSGGLWGRGLFNSNTRVAKSSVPVQQSDFIFSVAGELLGFVGCALIIVLLALLLLRTLRTARRAGDMMGSTICLGFFGMIMAQTLFNLGMCLNLLPVMGVTLPFFSAGGSSASCLYFGFGLVLNVYMHKLAPDKVNLRL